MLPSIATTYWRIFRLFADSFLIVLPFTLLYATIDFALDNALPYKPSSATQVALYVMNLILTLMVSILFFTLTLYSMYQRHQKLKLDYGDIFKTCIKRYFPVLTSAVLIILPLIVMSYIVNFISDIVETLGPSEPNEINLATIFMLGVIILFFISIIFWILFCLYFYVSSVFIIIKKESAVAGLKKSRLLLKGSWIRTFVLVFLLVFILAIVQMLLYLVLGDLALTIVTIFMLPLTCALMIIHYEQLAQTK